MYNLVIVPNNSGNFGVGHFNTLEAARSAQKNIHERLELYHESSLPVSSLSHVTVPKNSYVSVSMEDDYGSFIDISAAYISYTAIVDVQKKSEAQIEAKLSEARANKGFQERMMTSKELQVLSRFAQSQQQPQVIQVSPQSEQPSQPN
jgi:hypothetical protein